MKLPRFIGICGYPESGKTTVANILIEQWDAILVDDGAPLRRACLALYGGTPADWSTQEGKAGKIEVLGEGHSRRDLLGTLGNALEKQYGEHFMPALAVKDANERFGEMHLGPFVFPSVRKTQGHFYKQHGGVIIAVNRPGKWPHFDFDHFDHAAVDYWLNNTDDLETLTERAVELFEHIARVRGAE